MYEAALEIGVRPWAFIADAEHFDEVTELYALRQLQHEERQARTAG